MSDQFRFDDSEFADVPDDAPQEPHSVAMDEIVDGLEQSPAARDEALGLEVEKRFEVAMYYRELLKNSLFGENTEPAQIVEGEVRAFIRDRLETLMGIRAPKPEVQAVEPQFTENEAIVLKELANRVLKSQGKPSKPQKPAQPTVRKTTIPTPKPAAPAPAQAPARKRPLIRPGQAQRKPAAAPTKSPEPAQAKPLPENDIVEDTGEIVKEDGKTYRIVKNELGTTFRQNITGQVVPDGVVPMPSGAALAYMTEQQAVKQINKLDGMAIHAAAGAIAGIATSNQD